ncbi:L,D-transpeptidase [candidate division WOR-3 bacterium]|nr:L,D-transpeptidase [candidate division WOR-3 bacterium]
MFRIIIKISQQKLYLYENNTLVKEYPVSTSKYGVGNKQGSNMTPLGKHVIKNKIGKFARKGEILRSCRRTGKIAVSGSLYGSDVITTRILRLAGLETGINKGEHIDSYKRAIYIHGTPQEHLIGKPASHGCIRMRRHDIVDLFDRVCTGTVVFIKY